MKLPGFNAEASLGATANYFAQSSAGETRGAVAAFRRRAAGCGACTELKWPNGTGTGVCRQDCCDDRGNCSFQSCSCGGGASSALSTRVFSGHSFARF